MRELKFRIWDKADREWTSYAPVFSSAHGKIFEFFPSKYQAVNLVIQQYTGLKDINGKEIYEGDIMKVHGFLYDRFSRDEEPISNFTVKYYSNGTSISKFSTHCMSDYPCEVIGNIFENPELVK